MNRCTPMWLIPLGAITALLCGVAALRRRRANRIHRAVRRAERTLRGMAHAIRHMPI